MKTKTLLYILMSILLLSFASCTDDDKIDNLTKDEIPESIQIFASKYLPNNKMLSAYIDKDYGREIFVQFEGGVKAQFLPEGEWFILESGKGLPETTNALLSENSRKQLSEQIATAKVLMMTNPATGDIGIYLDNYETYYDLTGHEGKTLAEDGEWFYMKESEKENTVKDKFIKAIPAEVLATLKKEEPNAIASIQKITRFDDNKIYGFNKLYGFTFGDNQFILINSENQVVEPPLDKAKEYIKKAFNPQKEFQYKINSNTISPYFLRYSFKVTGLAEDILLVTDVDGNMRDISAGPITTESGKTIALPRAAIEMLPEAIVNYFDTNYSGKDVIHIYHSYSKIGDVPPTVNLTMPIPNNLKTLVFDTGTGQFIKEFNTIGG